MLDLLAAGRQLRLRAAVDDIHRFRAKTLCASCGVHRDVSAAHDGDTLCVQDGRLAPLLVRLHEVGAREVLIRGEHALCALSGNAHEPGKSRARAEEHCLEAVLLFEFLDREHSADDGVRLNLHAERLQPVHFAADDVLGQTEFGDAVDEDAARNVQCLKDGDVIPALGKIARAGESRRTRPDDRDFVPVALRFNRRGAAVLHMPVCDEALQPADADRLTLDATRALALALRLLRADPAADRGQRGGALDDLVRLLKLPLRDERDKGGNVHRDRTARHAGLVLAVHAALGFLDGGRLVIAERDFLEIFIAD